MRSIKEYKLKCIVLNILEGGIYLYNLIMQSI
jgi:hypothetical protein